MLSEIGLIATVLAFLASVYAVVAAVWSIRTHSESVLVSARNSALLTFPLLTVAALTLVIMLIRGDYQNSYVWSVSNPSTPLFYRITALWGSQKGSLLFWSVLMSLFAVGALILNWRSHRRLMPQAIAYMMAVQAFFIGLTVFMENPFERWWLWPGRDVAWIESGLDAAQRATVADVLAQFDVPETSNLGSLSGEETGISAVTCQTLAQARIISEGLRAQGIETSIQAPQNDCIVESAFRPENGFSPAADRLAETARGLNPLLRHFGMIIHPPMLYLGFVGMLIPFAFAMAALGSGDLSTNWIQATRRWALIGWLFLSLGLILGGRWAYDVLGWGGYWGWDPVENAAFIPWLIGTAFIHSVMIQEKRGMLKVWNMVLVLGTFFAVMFGTFATRSGLIDSVHAFARSEIGMPMFLFWTSVTVISVAMLVYRWNRGELKDDHQFVNLLSRESLFVLNNIIFVLLALAIFWGSFGAPIVSNLFANEEITLGIEYYHLVTPPLFVAMYILMGIAPLSAWGITSLGRLGKALIMPGVLTLGLVLLIMLVEHTADPMALFAYGVVSLAGFVALYETYRGAAARRQSLGENWLQAVLALFQRNRRRYGGYLVHLGITVIGIGVVGSTIFQQETQQTLGVGESIDFAGYTMRYDGFTEAVAEDGRLMEIADVIVQRDGQFLAHLRPRHDIYPNANPDQPGQNMTIAGAYSTLEADFYVLLVGWEPTTHDSATFKVYVNPLVNLIWWGGLILILGTFVSAWPHEKPLPARQTTARRSGAIGAEA
jgi:cytochrome c-type biogenesis protein CcmF